MSRWPDDAAAKARPLSAPPLVRVLVVDDHAAFRAAAVAMLQSEGFQVVSEAGTGADAIAAAETLRPDLVLLDVRLPDIDGFAVAEALAALAPAPVVVLVSSRDAVTFGARLRASPARGFLPKSMLSGESLRALVG